MTRLVAWLLLAAIVALMFVPPAWRPVSRLPHTIEHFAIFLLMAAAFARAYPSSPYALGLTAIIFIGILEALQVFAPGRHASVRDFLVNVAGACAGIAIATVFDRLRRQRYPQQS
jgi:VanZ family protein